MTVYLLRYKLPFVDLTVSQYDNRADAFSGATIAQEGGHKTAVVETEDDLTALDNSIILAGYNFLAKKNISKFENASIGRRRFFDALTGSKKDATDASAEPSSADAIETTEGDTDMATKKPAKKTKTPNTPKAPKAPRVKKEKKPAKPKVAKTEGGTREGSSMLNQAIELMQRPNGVTRHEAIAALSKKHPEKKETAVDNTFRSFLNYIPNKTKLKMKKSKEEGRKGTIYRIV